MNHSIFCIGVLNITCVLKFQTRKNNRFFSKAIIRLAVSELLEVSGLFLVVQLSDDMTYQGKFRWGKFSSPRQNFVTFPGQNFLSLF